MPVDPGPRIELDADIVPLFVCRIAPPPDPVAFAGTGFVAVDHVLVTCWHCVEQPPPKEHAYGAIVQTESGAWRVSFLQFAEQDPAGNDLATGIVDLPASLGLRVSTDALQTFYSLWTAGFPYTQPHETPEGGVAFELQPRFLKTHSVRHFIYDHRGYVPARAYELDRPMPRGMSGAPLVQEGTRKLYGVVFGNNDVEEVLDFGRRDADTGKVVEPEQVRVVSFGLAYDRETLWDLRGTATGDRPLGEVLDAAHPTTPV